MAIHSHPFNVSRVRDEGTTKTMKEKTTTKPRVGNVLQRIFNE